MGALYIIAGIALAGVAMEMLASVVGEGKADRYDYHFALGVGAVFGSVQ